LNGKRLGKKKAKDFKAMFKARYVPGELTAIAYDNSGGEVSRSTLKSADKDTRISILPEKETAKPGEIVYVDVQLTDANGIVESNADSQLNVSVQGGELLAFGSANPKTEENYNKGIFTTYYGRALAVVRAGETGEGYSDPVAQKFFNADNCVFPFNFNTIEEMENCIRFWLQCNDFVRLSIVDKHGEKAVGTIEMFSGKN
jgi:hypothetical protein